MAHHKASIKSIRQDAVRYKVNGDRKSRIRTFIKKVEKAISIGDKDEALSAFKAAQKEISRGVSKGILKGNTASRKISRLNAGVKAIDTSTSKPSGKTAAKKPAAKK